MFKYNILEKILYGDKLYIIRGRAEYQVYSEYMYMIQPIGEDIDNLDFTQCTWVGESKITKS